jgi:hypothetical protein
MAAICIDRGYIKTGMMSSMCDNGELFGAAVADG